MAKEGVPENTDEQGNEAPEGGKEGKEKPEEPVVSSEPVLDPRLKEVDARLAPLEARTNETVADKISDSVSDDDEEEEDTADTGDVEDLDDDADDPDEGTSDAGETADMSDNTEEDEEEEEEEEEEEDDFWGPVKEAFEQEGLGAAILVAIKLWMGWGDKEKEEAGENEENPLFRTDLFETDDPESKKLLETAKTELDKVKEDNPTWIDLAFKASEEYDLGPKGPATILAMARFESHFNPDAEAESSSATGLGQFVEGTWGEFQDSLDEDSPYKGKLATDPEASIMAIAWYSAENMKDCKIKPTDPEFTAKLYEAHHQGAAGAKTMWKFREDGEPEGEIPGWAKKAKEGAFSSFGVEKVETYEDYALLVDAMSGKVQLVADMYQGEIKPSEDNSDE